ncbi:MAG: T9SS type A sorting domain-containing protein, partial [Bacteroidales bacterium]
EGVGPNCGFRNFLEPTWDLLNDYLLCMEKGGELYYKNATNLPCDVKVRYLGEGKNEANQKNIDFVFTISPNPAHQEVEISIKQPNLSNLTMEVLDLSGRCLLRKAIESSTFLLPLEQYTPGLYLIKINTPQGNYARKLVVQ